MNFPPRPALIRFWRLFSKSQPVNGCLNWAGRKNKSGYGVFDYSGRPHLAHRVSFWLNTRLLPPGMSVLHRCDNPACINPAHLFLGTHQDNVWDMVSKGRHAHGPRHAAAMRLAAARGQSHMSRTRPDAVRRGENASGSRLTNEQVLEIRRRCAGGVKQSDLASEFHVNQSQISDVVSRVTWRHL